MNIAKLVYFSNLLELNKLTFYTDLTAVFIPLNQSFDLFSSYFLARFLLTYTQLPIMYPLIYYVLSYFIYTSLLLQSFAQCPIHKHGHISLSYYRMVYPHIYYQHRVMSPCIYFLCIIIDLSLYFCMAILPDLSMFHIGIKLH